MRPVAFPVRRVAARAVAALFVGVAAFAAGCSKPSQSEVRLPDFADLVEAVSPSVVNISTVPRSDPTLAASPRRPGADDAPGSGQGGTSSGGDAPSGENLPDWMRKFLEQHGNQGGSGGEGPAPGEGSAAPDAGDEEALETQESLGSGFVLWKEGYIITNAHVVKDAKDILVRLADRRELPATLVGLDEPSDLALLKIDAKDLVPVTLGKIAEVRVGQWVTAIGSPFGFDYSVTAGIVSAKGRNLFTEQYVPFLQTDAAINPGNSGGPLFNLKGEVIGVNSQIYSQTGGNSGIAFAIPIDVAVKVAQQLRDKGRVVRGWLGVEVQELTRELLESFGLTRAEGALVARVVPGSPAEQAGLKAGDVILAFNDQPLPSSRELPPLVGSTDPNTTVPLKVLRDGKQVVIRVQIGELPADAARPAGAVPPARASLPLGIAVRALSEDERRAARVTDGGVLVMGVEPGAAQEAGVREGDILLTIQGQAVDSVERLKDVTGRLTPGASVPMLVQRNGGPLFLALEAPGVADGAGSERAPESGSDSGEVLPR